MQIKSDVSRLRARNAELTQLELENDVLNKQLEESQVSLIS